jgi:hypothetical protein
MDAIFPRVLPRAEMLRPVRRGQEIGLISIRDALWPLRTAASVDATAPFRVQARAAAKSKVRNGVS